MFGTTSGSGSDSDIGAGTVYEISADGKESMLYAFRDESEAAFPSRLVEGTDGILYGTAGGGPLGNGVVFMVTAGGAVKPIYSFGSGTQAS